MPFFSGWCLPLILKYCKGFCWLSAVKKMKWYYQMNNREFYTGKKRKRRSMNFSFIRGFAPLGESLLCGLGILFPRWQGEVTTSAEMAEDGVNYWFIMKILQWAACRGDPPVAPTSPCECLGLYYRTCRNDDRIFIAGGDAHAMIIYDVVPERKTPVWSSAPPAGRLYPKRVFRSGTMLIILDAVFSRTDRLS